MLFLEPLRFLSAFLIPVPLLMCLWIVYASFIHHATPNRDTVGRGFPRVLPFNQLDRDVVTSNIGASVEFTCNSLHGYDGACHLVRRWAGEVFGVGATLSPFFGLF